MPESPEATRERLRKVVLERFEFCVARRVSGDVVRHILAAGQLDVYAIDRMLDEMAIRLRVFMCGETLDEVSYPADWWQAFKERWFPKRLLRRFPVRRKTVWVRAYYPSVSLPRHDPRVTLVTKSEE